MTKLDDISARLASKLPSKVLTDEEKLHQRKAIGTRKGHGIDRKVVHRAGGFGMASKTSRQAYPNCCSECGKKLNVARTTFPLICWECLILS
jgi:hypothetical protein